MTKISFSVQLGNDKKREYKINVHGKIVKIPVDEAVFAHFQNQYKNNTTAQQQRLKTLEHLVRAAYLHGLHQSSSITGGTL